jgi:DNA polymerase-3 subunit beta
MLAKDELRILANNPEQEEAEDVVSVEYSSAPLEIGFNVSYLIDVLNVVTTETVQMVLTDTNSSVLMQTTEGSPALFVVMPMRL